MKCPHCEKALSESEVKRLNAQLQGSKTSAQKSISSKLNGKLGGRPKKNSGKGINSVI